MCYFGRDLENDIKVRSSLLVDNLKQVLRYITGHPGSHYPRVCKFEMYTYPFGKLHNVYLSQFFEQAYHGG